METTLVPFAALPSCALDCGHLYDANGACVPPSKPTADANVYGACFCADARVAPFSAGPSGVCDTVCTAPGDAGAMQSIQQWFTSFCSQANKAVGTTTPGGSQTTGGSSSGAGRQQGGGGDWLSGHWQWVVFIVVVVVGIIGIWVGACIWRRRYLRKRDRQYALGKALARRSSTSGAAGQSAHSVHMPSAGMFNPATISSANVYDMHEKPREKKERKKWVVTERT